jgi:hypothetical protein
MTYVWSNTNQLDEYKVSASQHSNLYFRQNRKRVFTKANTKLN